MLATGAVAASQRITIAPGSLADALTSLGKQANIDIGSRDAGLSAVRIKGFSASGSPAQLLDRLLRGTEYQAMPISATAFRIVHRAQPLAAPRQTIATRMPEIRNTGDIVVIASKRERALADYPGGTVVLTGSDDAFGATGSSGSRWLLSRTPVLQSTELGAGRNKLFIRGIADSSFAGPTQATVSTYYGGVRIGYSGPDPNLNLYDIDQIEILEGPQGTLYGAGSLGGIILLNPHAPQLDKASGAAQIGASMTQHGGPGYDSAGMVNWAPWSDRLAIRLVGYRSREGGYINSPGVGKNLNSFTQTGGRVAVRVRPIHGMTIDGSYILQNSEQPDLQYTTPGIGALSHVAAVDQPFADHFRMARLVAEQKFAGGWTLSLSAGRVTHDTEQRYDATRAPPPAPPIAYDESVDIALTTVEAHLGHALRNGGGWLVGFSGVWDTTRAGRTFGFLATPRDLIGVSNRTQERAGYGEWTLPIGKSTKITIGGRYTSARMDGEPSRTPTNRDFIKGQTTKRFDPELGITRHLSDRLQWFGQYTQGFRTGGLAVARGAGRVATYDSDHVAVVQTGVRMFRSGPTGLAGYAAVSYARWTDIQADLLSVNGFPFTANVGDGRILTFEAAADWAVTRDIRLRGAFVVNRSRLIDPTPEFVSSDERPLPASPSLTGMGRAAWAHKYGSHELRADIHMRYVGRSRLGVGPQLDIPYGNFFETGATGAIAFKRVELSLGIDNLLDAKGNRFAIGNPFAIAARDEATPIRPRTVRLGLSTTF